MYNDVDRRRLEDLKRRSQLNIEQYKIRAKGLVTQNRALGLRPIFVEGNEERFYSKWCNKQTVKIYPAPYPCGRAGVLAATSERDAYGIIDLDYCWVKNLDEREEDGIEGLFVLEENNHEMMLLRGEFFKEVLRQNISISPDQYEFAERCAFLIGELRAVVEMDNERRATFTKGGEYLGCSGFRNTMGTLDVEHFRFELMQEFNEWNRDMSDIDDFQALINDLPPHESYQLVNGKELMHFISHFAGNHDRNECYRSVAGLRNGHEQRFSSSDFSMLSIVRTTDGNNFWEDE